MALTDLQERFVQEFLIDLNPELAATRAGYKSPRDGKILMQIDEVVARIEEAKAERAKRLEVKADWIVEQLRLVVERCMQLEPVTEKGQPVFETDQFGEVRVLVKFNPQPAIKALELLGKHVGIFVDKVEHSGRVETHDVSENEIARRIAFILQQAMRERGVTIQ